MVHKILLFLFLLWKVEAGHSSVRHFVRVLVEAFEKRSLDGKHRGTGL